MFNNDDKRKKVPVQLALTDGRRLEGNLILPMSVDVKRVLNGDGLLLEFETIAGVPSLIAKAAITEIIPSQIAAA